MKTLIIIILLSIAILFIAIGLMYIAKAALWRIPIKNLMSMKMTREEETTEIIGCLFSFFAVCLLIFTYFLI